MTSYTLEEQKQHRKELVEALRSGDYEQGRSMLRLAGGTSKPRCCCLGVACDISGLGRWCAEQDGAEAVLYELSNGGTVSHNLGHPDLREYFGFVTSNGDYRDPATAARLCLAKQNDDGATFEEIADVIESEPTGLVVR